ncbi:hypothetical protein NIES25_69440 (plasmid) [Nostoc linckia NIES-25]|nr:hypothetical protein NIES25_69440 [Nostoc linckia NIES-25]
MLNILRLLKRNKPVIFKSYSAIACFLAAIVLKNVGNINKTSQNLFLI